MKDVILSTLLLVGIFESSFGQNIYIEENLVSAIGAAAELIEAPTYIVNNSGSSVDFKWERIEYNLPAGWNASFCDKNNCYAPSTTTATFNLISGESGLLKPIFTPDEIEGLGIMKVRIYSITSGTTFDDTVTFQATTNGLVGTNDLAEASSIEIYPTITNGSVYLTTALIQPHYYTIINSEGRTIYNLKPLQWHSNNSEIDISPLNAGLYYVLLYSQKQALLVSKRIIKLQ